MDHEIEKRMASSTLRRTLLEYWETCDARQGGMIGHIDEKNLRIQSPVDMPIGGQLHLKIFFSLGHDFEEFAASARIVGKDLSCQEGWETFEYELEFIRILEEDRLKLRDLLRLRQLRKT
jgi:hypothetical protein